MTYLDFVRRASAVGMILLLCCYATPPTISADSSRLKGTVVSMGLESVAPISGARVHLADSRSDRIYTSQPTTADGEFLLEELPPSIYNVAVEIDGGLYVVATPVVVHGDGTDELRLAIHHENTPPVVAAPAAVPRTMSFRDNPLTAALIVLGAAFAVGLIVDATDGDDDDDSSSPSIP